jgi:hypothetical protein
MGSVLGLGMFLRGLAIMGGLATMAALTGCAGAAPDAAPSTVPAFVATVPAGSMPTALAPTTARGTRPASPPAKAKGKGKGKASPGSAPTPATSAGGTVAAAGNPAGHAAVPQAAQAVAISHPDHVIGTGTPGGCTSAAVVTAVAAGGVITFNCGPRPVTITMTATAKVSASSHEVVLDGGGKVTLSGGGTTQILFMNPGWQQQWPRLVVQNLAFTGAYSATRQASGSSVYGGGAIFAGGGQLKVVNSSFAGNRCYASGPDLGGGAIRAVGMYPGSPVYITGDTFTGNSCSNGGALSGLYAKFDVLNSVLAGNQAIGWGANPAAAGTAGGGSGGAIYTDGNSYDLTVAGTVMRDNTAREGGGGIFFVVNAGGGTLRITGSTLAHNPSGQFQNAPGIFDSVNGQDTQPVTLSSSIG